MKIISQEIAPKKLLDRDLPLYFIYYFIYLFIFFFRQMIYPLYLY